MTVKNFSDDSHQKINRIVQMVKRKAKYDVYIESFGVKICIGFNRLETGKTVEKILQSALPNYFRVIEKTKVGHRFELILNKTGKNFLFKNELEVPSDHSRLDVLRGFESQIRVTVAEYAVGRVFMHAGVVGWKERAIVIPANSFKGKTALVAELIKCGAVYYSDEFAVFDAKGSVHPFLKTLSIRGEIDEYTQKEYPVEAFGGKSGSKKLPVGLVLLTEYRARGRWNPKQLSTGQGILEMLPHVASYRHNPKFSITVLSQAVNDALIVKTFRGDAAKTAALVLDFFDSRCIC